MRFTLFSMLFGLGCLGTPALSQTDAAKDVIATPAGNSVRLPSGWHRSDSGRLLRLEAPEGDLSIAIVDVGRSIDAKSAAKTAWSLFRPDDRHRLTDVTTRPGRRGWDERVDLSYETSPAENVGIGATAYRHGDAWTVVIMDGSRSTLEKQDGATSLIYVSLHPAGYTAESFAGRTPHALDAARIEAMRSFVEASMQKLGIPGAAFALIDHGRVVFEGGLGLKELRRPDRVDARTLFEIASNTKGMTTLLLSRLVDQHKLAWEEAVVKAYPTFRVADPALTASLQIRDLVCACTGLPRTDFEWELNTPSGTKPEVTFSQLSGLKPTSKPGALFQYNNQMPSAAGYIAGHLLYPTMEIGAAYDRAMQTLVFNPLRMKDTTLSFDRALRRNVAKPHSDDVDGHPQVMNIAFDTVIIPFRPAGGAWSSAHDLIKYVGLELSEGVLPDGTRLVSTGNLLERRVRRVSTGANQWYGMGLWEDANSGVSVIYHGGNMPGYFSDIDIIPSAQVGAVILTNSSNGNLLVRPFRRRLLELLYDGKPEAADDVTFAATSMRADTAKDRLKLAVPADPAIVSRLAHRYTNVSLGPLFVKTDTSGTRIVTNSMNTLVASTMNDDKSISLVPITPGADGSRFSIGDEASRPTLTIRNGQHSYIFYAK